MISSCVWTLDSWPNLNFSFMDIINLTLSINHKQWTNKMKFCQFSFLKSKRYIGGGVVNLFLFSLIFLDIKWWCLWNFLDCGYCSNNFQVTSCRTPPTLSATLLWYFRDLAITSVEGHLEAKYSKRFFGNDQMYWGLCISGYFRGKHPPNSTSNG